jgi:hypothetical protein
MHIPQVDKKAASIVASLPPWLQPNNYQDAIGLPVVERAAFCFDQQDACVPLKAAAS